MARHMGVTTRKIPRGVSSTVFHRGREIGRVGPHGRNANFIVAHKRTAHGYKLLGVHTTRKGAVDQVARSFHPRDKVGRIFNKPKRPRNIFKSRTHPTQSLGIR